MKPESLANGIGPLVKQFRLGSLPHPIENLRIEALAQKTFDWNRKQVRVVKLNPKRIIPPKVAKDFCAPSANPVKHHSANDGSYDAGMAHEGVLVFISG